MSYEHDEELARLRAEVETLRAELAEKDVLLRRAVALGPSSSSSGETALMQAELFSSRLAPASASKSQIALSLMQPWPWAIFEAGKRLENRSQKGGGLPLVCRHRGPLWLAASAREPKWYWEESLDDMLDAGLIRLPGTNETNGAVPEMPARGGVPRGCIVGRCNVVGYVSPQRVPKTARNGRDRLEMVKHFDGPRIRPALAAELSSPTWHRQQLAWWGEGYALILADVHKLRTPIPCKGSQGLWRVQPETAAQLEGAELIPCAA